MSSVFENLLSQGMDPDEKRAKRAILFNQIFGKDEARDLIYQDQHMKGLPPINFFRKIFGDDLSRGLMHNIETKYDIHGIERMEDYDQIAFVKHVIDTDLGAQFPWWKKRLPIAFARYIKDGEQKAKEVMYGSLDNDQKASRLGDMLESLRQNGVKITKEHVHRLAQDAFEGEDELVNKYIDSLYEDVDKKSSLKSQSRASSEDDFSRTEHRITTMMSDYVPLQTAVQMMEQAKEDASIGMLKKSTYYQRVKVYESLTNQDPFFKISTQRQAIVASWIKTWLKI